MRGSSYKSLIAWQKADELAHNIYTASQVFPKEELYCVTSQLRRAALSIPTNIVEGYARKGNKELKHFLNISRGSLSEVEYLLDFSLKRGYLDAQEHIKLQKLRDEVGGLLWNFHKSVK